MFLILQCFIIICQIGFIFNTALEQDSTDVCKSEECYRAANYIKRWLEANANPCEDFYEYACGQWRNVPEGERINRTKDFRDEFTNYQLKTILQDSSVVKESPAFEALKNFLSVCTNQEDIDKRGASPLLPLLKKAGGWPVLESDWSEDNWDFINTEIVFGGALVDVVINQMNMFGMRYSFITIDLSSSMLPIDDLKEGLKNKKVQNYFNSLVNVAVDLGADQQLAEKELRESLDLEIAFAEEANKVQLKETPDRFRVSELNKDIPWLNWTLLLEDYLQGYYPIYQHERFMVNKPEYFKLLGKFFTQYPIKTVANFILSKAIIKLLPDLSQRLSNQTRTEKEIFGNCADIASKNSLAVATASYLATVTKDERDLATDMFIKIREELKEEVEEIEWLDDAARSVVTQKLSDLQFKVGFPEALRNVSQVNSFYNEFQLEINPPHYFEAKLADNKWKKKYLLSQLLNPLIDETVATLADESFRLTGQFNMQRNDIELSGQMLLFFPLARSKLPRYVTYGHLGLMIAHELIHALDMNAAPPKRGEYAERVFKDREFDSNKYDEKAEVYDESEEYENEIDETSLLYRFSNNETEQIYIKKRQCFIDQYSSFNDTKNTQLKLKGRKTKREDMADNGGLKLVLKVYRKLAEYNGEPKLPSLEHFSNEQLFLISSGITFCEVPNKTKIYELLETDEHSLREFRIKGMAMNSPDFSQAFHCKSEEPMNPVDKCEVWYPLMQYL